MAKRLIDVVLAGLGLALTAPVLGLAALAIRLTSPGPVLYRARRVGRDGRCFTMYKLRTMQTRPSRPGSRITGQDDPRVFPLGRWLRRTKIDELPQLYNVLRGDMSIVGPRPEDPDIVQRHYTLLHHETLRVRPGLASPGAIYHYTHGDALLTGGDPETVYAERLLPLKLALDVVYVRHASLGSDVRIIGRTVSTITAILAGRRRFPEPPEAAEALALMEAERMTCDTNAR